MAEIVFSRATAVRLAAVLHSGIRRRRHFYLDEPTSTAGPIHSLLTLGLPGVPTSSLPAPSLPTPLPSPSLPTPLSSPSLSVATGPISLPKYPSTNKSF